MKSFFFFLVYYTLVVIIYILALPYLFYLSFKSKYKDSIPARFFLYKNGFFKTNDIWFHACSLGEVKSLKAILDRLGQEVNISVITNTGFQEAKKLSNSVRFLPFEIWQPFWQKRQKTLVVMEAELWYMLFFIAKKRGTKTILLNARISDNSYNSYKRFASFYKMIFENIDEVFAQSSKDAQRLKELGAKEVTVIGNIKNSIEFVPTKRYDKPKDKRVILFASTHENEEKLLLENIKLKDNDILIVAPRHPERFEEVEQLLKKFCKKNKLSFSTLLDEIDSDVVLCDKMGELINLYSIADISVLGGSFIDGIGGHNPLEPAYFNNTIISGRYFHNQIALYDAVSHIYICKEKELQNKIDGTLERAFIKHRVDLSPIVESIKSVV